MDSEGKVQKAYEALFAGDFAKAEEWFEEAIEADPSNASLHYKLSITYARNNKQQRAVLYAANAVHYEPGNDLYKAHLQRLEAQDLLQQAETYYDGSPESIYVVIYLLRQSIKLDPITIESYLLLTDAYGGLEEYFLAVQTAKDAVRLAPGNEAAIHLLNKYMNKLQEQLHK